MPSQAKACGGILKHSSPGPRHLSAADVADIAYLAIEDATAESSVFDRSKLGKLAKFRTDSFGIGKLIGEGVDCNVNEIQRIASPSAPVDEGGDGGKETAAQNYVVKIIKPSMKADPVRFGEAIEDLVREACFLSSLEHPNIIQIHGTYFGSDVDVACDATANECYIVLERLQETLEQRMVTWKKQERKAKRNFLHDPKKTTRAHLLERLKDARDIAKGMGYLHDHRIIFRDLKSSNVGYDSSGGIKIFDFGLATEIPDSMQSLSDPFRMSGSIDSYRYLAPECIKCQPYNLSADVYAFGVLLYEMCELKRAYEGFDKYTMHYGVACGEQRPEMSDSLPFEIRKLIRACWSDDMNVRPFFDTVVCILDGIIGDLEEEQKRLRIEKKEKKRLLSIKRLQLDAGKREKEKNAAAARGA